MSIVVTTNDRFTRDEVTVEHGEIRWPPVEDIVHDFGSLAVKLLTIWPGIYIV